MTAGDTNFRYKVQSCFGSNPLCGRTAGTNVDEVTGPLFWNSAAQGLNFGGSALLFDLNGATLPVTWNTANMTTNGSLGALLLHHHNTTGKRAQVVTLQAQRRRTWRSRADAGTGRAGTGTERHHHANRDQQRPGRRHRRHRDRCRCLPASPMSPTHQPAH